MTPSKYSEVEQGAAGETFDKNMLKSFTKNKAFKTRHKLKAHTSKIVSSFKPPAMTCMLAKEFRVRKNNMTCQKTREIKYNFQFIFYRAIVMEFGTFVFQD